MMDMDTIIFEIKEQDAHGRIRMETKHPIYSKYNKVAPSYSYVFRYMNDIAEQMNNAEGMGCAFTVEGL